MADGAPVDPNLSLADMLPPDKADASRILGAAHELVAAVARRTPDGRAEVTVSLDADGWRALEAERRRYLRPHASYVYAPHPDGAGAARLVRAGEAEALTAKWARSVEQLAAELARFGLEARWNGERLTLHRVGGERAPAELCRDPDCKPEAHPAGSPGCVSDPTCGGTRDPAGIVGVHHLPKDAP